MDRTGFYETKKKEKKMQNSIKEKALEEDTSIFDTDMAKNLKVPDMKVPKVKVPTFNPVDLSELLDRDFPPVDWLVDNFIARGDFVLCSGQPKVGKSLVWFQMMLHLSMPLHLLRCQQRHHLNTN